MAADQNLRIVYTDDTGAQQEIGFKQAVATWKWQSNAQLKVWSDPDEFNNIPTNASDFNTGYPEIFLQRYDGSNWVDEFRGFAETQGTINKAGEVAWKLYGHGKRISDAKVNISLSSTDNVSVMQALVDAINNKSNYANYTLQTDGTAQSIPNYDIKDRAGRVLHEMSRHYGWHYEVLPAISSGDYVIRYEDEGAGAAVDTISTDPSSADFDASAEVVSWSKERIKTVVNEVDVIGSDNSGNTYSATAVDSTSQSNYGERFVRVQIDYLTSDAMAQTIADNILHPDADEGGQWTSSRYNSIETNSSFNLDDNQRSISDAFTCTKQKNFYPEKRTDLWFTFEEEGFEKDTGRAESVYAQRARLASRSNVDVGSQTTSGDTETVSDQYDADSQTDHPHDVSGQTFSESTDEILQETVTEVEPSGGNSSASATIESFSNSMDVLIIQAWVQLNAGDKTSTTTGKDITVEDTNLGLTYIDANGITAESNFYQEIAVTNVNSDGNNLEMSVTDNDGIKYSYGFTVAGMSEFTINQPSQTDGAQGTTANLTINVNTSDSTAGDTSELSVSGSVAQDLIDIVQSIDKEDR